MYKFLIFNKKIALCAFFVAITALFAPAQQSTAYRDYIAKYKDVALRHQQEYGIPASITLAQGLLESRAGKSYLAMRGNNHFGIKCHSSWQGKSVQFDDTLRHTCYRQYSNAEDSFLDHSRFLMGKRYKKLFSLDITDYHGWAQGLKDCGYAEDPAYPQKLVKIIETYDLASLAVTTGKGKTKKEKTMVTDEIIAHSTTVSDNPERAILRAVDKIHRVQRKWKVHYVKAKDGDTMESIAAEFDLETSQLLEFNDATDATATLPKGMPVYLEKKLLISHGSNRYKAHEGDTWWSISQHKCVRLKTLLNINNAVASDSIQPGTMIQLR